MSLRGQIIPIFLSWASIDNFWHNKTYRLPNPKNAIKPNNPNNIWT